MTALVPPTGAVPAHAPQATLVSPATHEPAAAQAPAALHEVVPPTGPLGVAPAFAPVPEAPLAGWQVTAAAPDPAPGEMPYDPNGVLARKMKANLAPQPGRLPGVPRIPPAPALMAEYDFGPAQEPAAGFRIMQPVPSAQEVPMDARVPMAAGVDRPEPRAKARAGGARTGAQGRHPQADLYPHIGDHWQPGQQQQDNGVVGWIDDTLKWTTGFCISDLFNSQPAPPVRGPHAGGPREGNQPQQAYQHAQPQGRAAPEAQPPGPPNPLVAQIMGFGFTEHQATEAAKRCSSIEAAVDWIMESGIQ